MNQTRTYILGAGESGVGSALLAQKLNHEVFVSDMGVIKAAYKEELIAAGIDFEEGQHNSAKILQASQVIKSPGIPENAPLIVQLREANIPVISEIEFAGKYCTAKKVCITGSNGKTTTTLLTYHLLKQGGLNVGLAGNIGKSFARQVAFEDKDIYVLELSSFQLDGCYEFKADIAVLLNITPDHLDRYDYQLSNYAASKFRIIQNQGPEDHFIYNFDDPIISEGVKASKPLAIQYPITLSNHSVPPFDQGAFCFEDQLNIIIQNQQFTMKIQDLALQGKHNLFNSMASGVTSRIFELRKENVRDSLTNFENIEHRLENVGKVNGVTFINDSKATNINSTWYALESIDKPIIWIAGGVDKGNDYSELYEMIDDKVKAIICLGTDNKKLRAAFTGRVGQVLEVRSADEAVRLAYDLSSEGDTVLLSPACASFDLFENYEDRGHKFKQAVRRL
ncbi:MAG: UDP-N-acetylmuramoyl-L-alanine--D-glutamate ligase [Flavobacteriales bacterium]|nr:UDP-N-acetylmuramoyl-L-alanine--D-glutamate ligase [Flavobacteriales bacterium]